MRAKLLLSCPTLREPMGCSRQTPLSMGFPRQEHWSGLPFPSPGDLSAAGIAPKSLCLLHRQAGSLPPAPPGKPLSHFQIYNTVLLTIVTMIYILHPRSYIFCNWKFVLIPFDHLHPFCTLLTSSLQCIGNHQSIL